jgi:hypothetical protein
MNNDFLDMLRVFSEEAVEYLLVGAYALASHGYSRMTGDMDLWVRRSSDNAERVFGALQRFGAPLLGLSLADLTTPDIVFQIGIVPHRIDILTSIAGVEFDDAWPHRIEIEIQGLRVPVIGREALLINKKSTGRPKDLHDAAWLEGSV